MHIRDPIHGSIEITRGERRVIDSPYFQRLRHIKQLGFADLAFPGATHSRYSHSIGALSVATRLFEAIYRDLSLPSGDRARLLQTLRLAVLLHDLGHPPLSHTSERILPQRSALKLPAWLKAENGSQASHEDMTLLLLLESQLAQVIRDSFAELGIEPEDVASLLSPVDWEPGRFVVGGVDHGPLLRQLVSSELDADRMDYLLRDSLYTGVHYGRFDLDWIAQNVLAVRRGEALQLGIGHRAVFAFEDFLLSRYHMFLAVYYHYQSINFEMLLARFYESAPEEYRLPASAESYVQADDLDLLSALRKSENPWAKRVVERRGYYLLVEANPFEKEVDLSPLTQALQTEGIDHFIAESHGVLSKYFQSSKAQASIWVRTSKGEVQPVEEYTPVFQRYREAARLVRVYVDSEKIPRAKELAGPLARS